MYKRIIDNQLVEEESVKGEGGRNVKKITNFNAKLSNFIILLRKCVKLRLEFWTELK